MFDLCEFFIETNLQLIFQFCYTLFLPRKPSFTQILSLIKGVAVVQFKLTSISLPYVFRNTPQKSTSNTIARVLWVCGLNGQLGFFLYNDFIRMIGSTSDLNIYLVATYIIVCFSIFMVGKIYWNPPQNTKMKFFILSGMCLLGFKIQWPWLVMAIKKGRLPNIILQSLYSFANFEFVFSFGYAAFCVSSVGDFWKWDSVSPSNVFFKVVLLSLNVFLGFGDFIWTCYYFYLVLLDQAKDDV